jgi:hypothetical protein
MRAVEILAARYGDRIYITYTGRPDDLIALGYPTAEMCAAGKHGKRRLDPQGRKFGRVRHDNGCVSISVDCEPLEGLGLPGVFHALDAFSDLEPGHVGDSKRAFWVRHARADTGDVDVGPLLERFVHGPAASP